MSRKPKKMTLDEIKKMEAVCRLAAEALQLAGKMVKQPKIADFLIKLRRVS